MELLVLGMVVASPWFFGSVEPNHQFWLAAGVALLLVLWACRLLFQGEFTWRRCPIILCLAMLLGVGTGQLLPLPTSTIEKLSPAAARLYHTLLPGTEEKLPFGEEPIANVGPARGSTLSLYPINTRFVLLHILAVLVVFSVVRNNIACEASLYRLATVALINGAILSAFALVQYYSSPPNQIYWTYNTPGGVFGPFICRNHFPFYANICLGLVLGLLLSGHFAEPGEASRTRSWRRLWGLLDDSQSLWISGGLALVMASVAISQSRGGFVAVVLSIILLPVLHYMALGRWPRGGVLLPVITLAIGLAGWGGFNFMESRIRALFELETVDIRLPLWQRSWTGVMEFPVFGAGYGSYQFVERMHRTEPGDSTSVFDHAHNDFLEALVEGGLARFVPSMLAILCVYYFAVCGFGLWEGEATGGLLLGAVFGFTTAVVHSFFDFGLHIPAIALLLSVLAAQIAAAASPSFVIEPDSAEARPPGEWYRIRWLGLAPVGGALLLLGIGLLVLVEARRFDLLHRYLLASQTLKDVPGPVARQRRLEFLNEAVALVPDSAGAHLDLGILHVDAFHDQEQKLGWLALSQDVILPLLYPADNAMSPFPLSLAGGPSLVAAVFVRSDARSEAERVHLPKALKHFGRSRDLCPLWVRPHLRLAFYADRFVSADDQSEYIARAKFLSANDPESWYTVGLLEVLNGEPDKAWASWRRSLELGPEYLENIVDQAAAMMTPDELLARVLPNNPHHVTHAAARLFPRTEQSAAKAVYLQKAKMLFEQKEGNLTFEDWHVRARLFVMLDNKPDALAAYRSALSLNPGEMDLHCETAEFLESIGNTAEALQQVNSALVVRPNHPRALAIRARLSKAGELRK